MVANIQPLFPSGKIKALTLSYDDGSPHDCKLIEIMNRHGVRGTFHLHSAPFLKPVASGRISSEDVQNVYAGHEVAGHSVNHPRINLCPNELRVLELVEARQRLEQLVDYPVRGFSYPFGTYDESLKQLLPFAGIQYARTTKETYSFELPTDWLEWHPTTHHRRRLMELAERFVGLTRHLNLFYVWGHSNEFHNDDNWELMEQFCAYIGGRDDIWYATNIEIVDYMRAYQQLQWTVACDRVYNPTAQDVWVSVNGVSVEVHKGVFTRIEKG